MRLLITWLINALALLALPYIFTSIHVATFVTALVAALVLGLINTLIRPILVLLTLPVTLLTLGLFIFVINGLLFWFVGSFLTVFASTASGPGSSARSSTASSRGRCRRSSGPDRRDGGLTGAGWLHNGATYPLWSHGAGQFVDQGSARLRRRRTCGREPRAIIVRSSGN